MRLHPENHLARLAVALGRLRVEDARKALRDFHRARRITLQEFGAALLATGSIDRAGLEEIRAAAIATRMLCPDCCRVYRVYEADLEARIRCPSCQGRLALATDQKPDELRPGARPLSDPLYVARRGEPGRLEEGVSFDALEARHEEEARAFLAIAEAVRRGRDASGGRVVDGVAHFRPSLAWRRPRAAIVAAGCGCAVLLLAVLIVLSSGSSEPFPIAIATVGLVAVTAATWLVAWNERSGDRSEDRLLVSREPGIVQIQGGWIRRIGPGELGKVEAEGRDLVLLSRPSATTLRVGPANGYYRLRPIRFAVETTERAY